MIPFLKKRPLYTPNIYERIDFKLNLELDLMIEQLREKNIPSTKKRLQRHVSQKSKFVFYDDIYSLDSYYVNMINDALNVVRSGGTAYIFKISQIVELLRFEPAINVELYEGVYYITLPKHQKKILWTTEKKLYELT